MKFNIRGEFDDPYLYHSTASENLYQILKQGISPQGPTHRDTIDSDVHSISKETPSAPIINRGKSVFFYPFLMQAVKLTDIGPSSNSSHAFSRDETIIIVDSQNVDNDIYVGEFDLISDAIDFQHMDEPDDAMISESYSDALQRYVESLIPLKEFTDDIRISDQYETPEIVIQDGVSPHAIIDWLS